MAVLKLYISCNYAKPAFERYSDRFARRKYIKSTPKKDTP